MRDFKHAFALALGALSLLAPSLASAQTTDGTCPNPTKVAFVNGINTTQTGARLSAHALKRETLATAGDSLPDGETWGYYYNQTDFIFSECSSSASECGLSILDLFEVAAQKLDEGAALRGKYELIWYFLNGGDPNLMPSWFQRVLGTLGVAYESAQFAEKLVGYLSMPVETFLVDRAEELVQLAIDAAVVEPVLDDARGRVAVTVQAISNSLSADLGAGYNVLLVPHSQGNLYTNVVYDSLVASGGYPDFAQRVRALQVAVPASSVRGDYTTANQDRVIAALRVAFPSTLPGKHDVTVGEFFRHGFVETYLAPKNTETRGFIIGGVVSDLNALSSYNIDPEAADCTEPEPSSGDAVLEFNGTEEMSVSGVGGYVVNYALQVGVQENSALVGLVMYDVVSVSLDVDVSYEITRCLDSSGSPVACDSSLAEEISVHFGTADFDLAGSSAEFIAEGEAANPIPADFFNLQLFLAREVNASSPGGTTITWPAGNELRIGTADSEGYPEAGYFWSEMVPPPPYEPLGVSPGFLSDLVGSRTVIE